MQFITDIDQIDHILNIQGLIGLQQYDIFDGLAVRGRVVFKNRRKPGSISPNPTFWSSI